MAGLFGSLMNLFGGGQQGGGMPPQQTPAPTNAANAAKPKFFEEGGGFSVLAGSLGDMIKSAGGQQPTYLPAQEKRRQDEQAYQRQAALEALKASYRQPTAAQQNYQYYQGLPEPNRNTFMEFIRSQNQNPYTMFGGQPFMQQPTVSGGTAPAGVPQAAWDAMTPAERAKFGQ